MYIFIDTEFSRFDQPVTALLSLACVTEDGRSWYGVNADFDEKDATYFVREHVLPRVDDQPADIKDTLVVLSASLNQWLAEINRDRMEGLTVITDYSGDWYHFEDLLRLTDFPSCVSKSPDMIHVHLNEAGAVLEAADVSRRNADFMSRNNLKAHCALSDAQALRALWQECCVDNEKEVISDEW